MSSRSSTKENTKFCKVCKDKGLSKESFSSHNVRDEKGRVCCPSVMSHVCKKCDKQGHMEKYCVVKQKDGMIDMRRFVAMHTMKPEEKKEESKPVSKNAFSAFEADSSDDEEEVKPVVKKFTPSKRSWADWDSDDDEEDKINPNVTLRAHQTAW